jgi:hypothetical protein
MKKLINETKRMQQLAGLIIESQLNEDESDIQDDIKQDLMNGDFESTEDQITYLQDIISFCNMTIDGIKNEYPSSNITVDEAIHFNVLGDIESLIDPNTVDTAMDALGVIFNKLEQEGIDPKDIKTYIDMQINQAFGHQLGMVSR